MLLLLFLVFSWDHEVVNDLLLPDFSAFLVAGARCPQLLRELLSAKGCACSAACEFELMLRTARGLLGEALDRFLAPEVSNAILNPSLSDPSFKTESVDGQDIAFLQVSGT